MQTIQRLTSLVFAAASCAMLALGPAQAGEAGRSGDARHQSKAITEGVASSVHHEHRFDRRAAWLEVVLMTGRVSPRVKERLVKRLELNETQQDLLEALLEASHNARETIFDARRAITPLEEGDAENEVMIARFAAMVAMTTARAEALASVQPHFESFVSTLDADQVAALTTRPSRDRDRAHKKNDR